MGVEVEADQLAARLYLRAVEVTMARITPEAASTVAGASGAFTGGAIVAIGEELARMRAEIDALKAETLNASGHARGCQCAGCED